MAALPSLCCTHKPFSSFVSPIENPRFSSPNYLIQRRERRTIVPLITRRRSIVILNGLENDSNQKNVRDDEEVNNLGVKAALSMLKFYKREISPILPNSCRYVPTCSEYSMEAYKKYGVAKGTILTAWRLCRCNPLGGSGFDPPRWFDERSPSEE